MVELINLQNQNKFKLIEGVILYPLKINRDESGILVETLRTDWPHIYGNDRQFAMQYYSVTQPNVARDEEVWHCHNNQEDRFLVAKGEIVVAIADNREGSKTNGFLNLFLLKANDEPYILLIPKKTFHGFIVTSKEEAILLNFPTQLYNSQDELRIPHKEANVKIENRIFSWNFVREEFNLPNV